ncbi:DUF3768 domain-containing protein [Phaeobacter sp. A90a-4k]|uniref:DUF3768 domain-containing protein n=1 Tax=unclassified Phaeobacter TaxID=2621772 RepID=UPI003A8734FE
MAEMKRVAPDEREEARLIVEQNDRFRTTWGADFTVPGQIVMTHGVNLLPFAAKVAITAKVQGFKTFDADNDPHGEHDFGAIDVATDKGTEKIFWKIDLFDRTYRMGSDDPANPALTRRVLTVMLASEY